MFRPGRAKEMTMVIGIRSGAAAAAACISALIAPFCAAPALATMPAGELASHRAIYELALTKTHGKPSVASARGRILYDFSGTTCEGYKLGFRQVLEVDNGEGKVTLSDLRSETWEEGGAKSYRFKSENYIDQRLVESTDGSAERRRDSIVVTLSRPSEVKLDLPSATVFPTEHVRRIIDAARAGKSILEFPVYDGSDTGQKVYNTLTVIGRAMTTPPGDAAAGQDALAQLTRWPVTVSYFEKSSKGGEQEPVYSLSYELYENGISRALLLDYSDFAISGELKSLEVRDSKPCP
jgi:hypothetical protein